MRAKESGSFLYAVKHAFYPCEDRILLLRISGKTRYRSHLPAITAAGLNAAGIATHATAQATTRGIWRTSQLEADWQLVRAALERAGIWYCPLKGAMVKDLYPALGLRQMADYDVLFDASRADDLCDIMQSLGFTTEHYDLGVHDVYYRDPVSNFEMHRSLFAASSERAYAAHFATVKDRLVKDPDNAHGWHMTLEDCYLYLLSHEHKHFSAGGTGLRSSLDIYVYLRAHASAMDWDQIHATASELGLSNFEAQQRAFAQHLFDDEPLTVEEERLFEYMASSRTYGTTEHRVENKIAAMGGTPAAKLRYLRDRLFPPLDDAYSAAYPFFGQRKYLLPAFYVYRAGKALAQRGRAIRTELASVISADVGD